MKKIIAALLLLVLLTAAWLIFLRQPSDGWQYRDPAETQKRVALAAMAGFALLVALWLWIGIRLVAFGRKLESGRRRRRRLAGVVLLATPLAVGLASALVLFVLVRTNAGNAPAIGLLSVWAACISTSSAKAVSAACTSAALVARPSDVARIIAPVVLSYARWVAR